LLVWSAGPGDQCPVLLPSWREVPGSFKGKLVALKLLSVYFSISGWFGQLDLVTSVLFFSPAGEKYLARADRARPLRLFFTDQTKAGGEWQAINCNLLILQCDGSIFFHSLVPTVVRN
jgi:hypothetical protein